MTRRNWIMLGILGLQMALLAFVWWPAPSAPPAVSLLSPILPDPIVNLTVVDAEGREAALTRRVTGWVLAEADDFPASESKVDGFLDQVGEFTNTRLVAETANSHDRLKVADTNFTYRFDFRRASGQTNRFFVGTSPRYGETHVRLDEQDEVYLVSLVLPAIGTNASAWVDTAYFSLPRSQINSIAIENQLGKIQLINDSDLGWILNDLEEGETMADGKVSTLINSVSSIHLVRPLGTIEMAEYGLQTPVAIVSIVTNDPDAIEPYTLILGAKHPDGNARFAKATSATHYVLVTTSQLNNLLEKSRIDLLVQAEVAAAT